MIDLYFWNTPNGYKPLLFLEESGLEYRLVPVNLQKREQFTDDFVKISPNSKIPALVDHQPVGGGGPLSLFESGALLAYLSEKTEGQFVPDSFQGRMKVRQWLFWQVGGIGPMFGQFFHFNKYAPEKISYAIERYRKESVRLCQVLEQALTENQYVACDSYSIADMAIYPWFRSIEDYLTEVSQFSKIKNWMKSIEEREGTVRAYEKGEKVVQ